jgi:uncharacterized protein YmfQ (DUF2313 family)
MDISRADYLSQLQALLPQGAAWTRERDAALTRLLDAFAEEFARVDARARQLLDESDPRSTYDTSRGGQSRAYFIALAEKFGYPGVTITEYHQMTCTSVCTYALHSLVDLFVWTLNIPATGGVFAATCRSPCNAALGSSGNSRLEAAINAYKPAHTTALLHYV